MSAKVGTTVDMKDVHQTGDVPAMSIVVAIDTYRSRAARCLRSLLLQRGIERCEIIVLDAGHANFPPIDGSDHAVVRVVPLPRGLSYGAALAFGVERARAPIVAFIEEHVVAMPGWAEAVLEAHTSGRGAVVGSEMIFDNPGRGASDLVDLLSVGPWTAPAVPGEVTSVRWQNVSYSRKALDSVGDQLSRYLDAEGVFFARLRADGHRLWMEPAAKLRHANDQAFGSFLFGAFHANRLLAARRAELQQFSPARRVLYAGVAIVNIFRTPGHIRRVLSRSPEFQRHRQFARAHRPHIAIYACAFSLGACTGFLIGPGDSGRRFLEHYELNSVRDIRGYEYFPGA